MVTQRRYLRTQERKNINGILTEMGIEGEESPGSLFSMGSLSCKLKMGIYFIHRAVSCTNAINKKTIPNEMVSLRCKSWQ